MTSSWTEGLVFAATDLHGYCFESYKQIQNALLLYVTLFCENPESKKKC